MGWTRSSRRCGPHCPAPEHQPSLRGAQRRSNPASNQAHDGLLRGACHRARIRATRWLAMTRRKFDSNVKQQIHVHILAAGDARGLRIVSLKLEGAGNAGCALHPRSRVQKAERKSHTSIQGSGGNPTFPAQWLYGLFRALPGVSGFLASVASRKLALWPGWAFAPPLRLDANH